MTYFCTLASGSSGNCALYCTDREKILIDAGRTASYIIKQLKEMGMAPEDLTHILVTHCHCDHVSALRVLLKHTRAELCCSHETYLAIRKNIPEAAPCRLFTPGESLMLGTCPADSFPTPHDAEGSCGFILGEGRTQTAVCTDLGTMTPTVLDSIRGSRAVLLESNYDFEMLRTGPYPYPRKKRIFSEFGHLSNDDAARAAAELCRSGTETLILGHLSEKNNTPELARSAVLSALFAEHLNAAVSVAPRNGPGEPVILEGEEC